MSILSKFNILGQIYQFCDAAANAFIRFSAFSFISFSFTTKLSQVVRQFSSKAKANKAKLSHVVRQFSSKAKANKAKSTKSNKSICDCITKLVYLTKDVESSL